MQHLEISLSNNVKGWYWTLLSEIDGKMRIIAESDHAFPTASIAAAEAEAQIHELSRVQRFQKNH
jgi:hypothetical protein